MTKSHRVLLLALLSVMVVLALADTEQTASDATSKANQKMDAYRNWLLENGARMDNLEFTRVARYGITVSPPKDLKRGASLAFLPKSLVVTTATIQLSHAVQHLSTESPIHQAALWLLEQLFTPESFWKPYIDVLPRKLPLSIFWSDDDLDIIKPTPLFEWTNRRLAKIKTKYRALFLPENRKAPLPESLAWFSKVTEADWKWALGIMWSRGLPSDPKYEGNLVLIPIEDMFTIMSPSSVEPHVRARMTPEGVEFVSNTDIPKGAVIEKLEPAARTMTTPQLAFQYGTVFETNKNDRLMLPSCAYFEKRVPSPKHLQILKAARCHTKEFSLKNGLDLKDFLCAARIFAMSEEDLANSTLVSRAQGRRMISPFNEHQATSCLTEIAGNVRDAFFPVEHDKVKRAINDDKYGYKALPPARRRAYLSIYHTLTTAHTAYFQGQRLNKQAADMVDGKTPFPPVHEKIGRKENMEHASAFPADDAKATTTVPLSIKKREALAAKQRAERRAAEAAKRKEEQETQQNTQQETPSSTATPQDAAATTSSEKDEL